MKSCTIEAKNVSISYNDNVVLQNVNFEVMSGDFICLVGKSGTGKTTLLNTIAGFLQHTGKLVVGGKIGFCFQNNSLFSWMSIKDNVAFGMDGNNKMDLAEDILEKIGLRRFRDKYPSQLSGGQVQRVALARAMAANPDILLLDEPFSSLDVFTRDSIIEWLLHFINETKITVIMVTHYIDEALLLSNRIFTMSNGTLHNEIEVDFQSPRTQEIKFTEKFQIKKQEILKTLN